MRQCGDDKLFDLLNHFRISELDNNDVSLLKLKFVRPKNSLHMFAENVPANTHNMTMLNSIDSELYKIWAVDNIPKNVVSSKIDQALDRGQSETGRLAYVLELKVVAKLMVTVNTDLDDRILSGQLGTVKHILKSKKGSVTKIYIASDDNQTTLKNMSKDVFGRQKLWVSI